MPPAGLLTARFPTIPPRSPFLLPRQAPCFRSSPLSRPPTRSASQWGPHNPRGQPRYNRSRYSRPRYSRFQRAQGLYQLWQTSPPFRYGAGAVGVSGGVFYYVNLERVPISNRLRFNCVPPSWEEQRGKWTLKQILQVIHGKVLPSWHPDSKLVNRVLKRLIPASGMEDLEWEVKVIDDPEQSNAFVLPGGKVFVFSGILPICGGEDGLAAVLGHEISHLLAHHDGEKMSGAFPVLVLSYLLASTFDTSAQLSQLLLDLVLSRPNSRKMESEADYIGLLMMAKACYNPNAVVGLWERMAKAEQNAPPQFLSTHPASKNRATRIQIWLPEAEEKRSQSDCGNMSGFADQFKQVSNQHVNDYFW